MTDIIEINMTDIIEIPAADLFELLFKHKKWLKEKKVENFQSLFQLSEAFNQIETSQRMV
jgi:hypothetical protein